MAPTAARAALRASTRTLSSCSVPVRLRRLSQRSPLCQSEAPASAPLSRTASSTPRVNANVVGDISGGRQGKVSGASAGGVWGMDTASAGSGSAGKGSTLDPSKIVGNELGSLSTNIQHLLGSGHPFLDRVAKYYVQSEGKHMRPMVVLLMSRAIHVAPKQPGWSLDDETVALNEKSVNTSIAPLGMLRDLNPDMFKLASTDLMAEQPEILGTQRRLAEITEMIHAASLLHDDVIDNSDSRRGRDSANVAFGNKMAVLAGDFLLGRASVALARLRENEVVELLSTVINNLVEGEFMQLQNSNRSTDLLSPAVARETLDYYLQKSYLKSASLISKSCRAAAVLGGSTKEIQEAAYYYGKNLGLAFQLVDDMLDYTVSAEELGKPAGADLQLGLATAPVLFAWEEFPELGPMIERKFEREGDVLKARELVDRSQGLARTKALAESYCQAAIDAIALFPDSEAKAGLAAVVEKALKRKK